MSATDGARWLLHYFSEYRVPARPELADGLGTIRCPTGIPRAELTLIEDAGHFVMEAAPDTVLAALRDLLTRDPDGDRSGIEKRRSPGRA